MDRVVALTVLLLVGFTWLLYKLIVFLEPRGDKPAAPAPAGGNVHHKLIHERLRK
ncbi:hypothetical protein [Steroidobacter cummioxidans]|uniref:hypothetical protein n=1 Tax=Steroidobacter cummioxidans TaxID=1803913 RepID=UPI00137B6735|nr:hypothetical protein [Steroidobacter cummioxidans]